MEIEDGYYIVEVDGLRYIAEKVNDEWYEPGYDYDHWQYRRDGPLVVKPIARIDINKLSVRILT